MLPPRDLGSYACRSAPMTSLGERVIHVMERLGLLLEKAESRWQDPLLTLNEVCVCLFHSGVALDSRQFGERWVEVREQ